MARNERNAQANESGVSGFLDRSASHLLHRALQRANDIHVEELGIDGLTQRQFAVLEAVAGADGLTQADLVRATGVDRSTLADLAARMTARGLLTRERSTVDGRAKAVGLSEEGRAMLEAARPCVMDVDRRILSALPKARRESFLELLAMLADDHEADRAFAARKAAKLARKAVKTKAEGKTRKARKARKSGKPVLEAITPSAAA